MLPAAMAVSLERALPQSGLQMPGAPASAWTQPVGNPPTEDAVNCTQIPDLQKRGRN